MSAYCEASISSRRTPRTLTRLLCMATSFLAIRSYLQPVCAQNRVRSLFGLEIRSVLKSGGAGVLHYTRKVKPLVLPREEPHAANETDRDRDADQGRSDNRELLSHVHEHRG